MATKALRGNVGRMYSYISVLDNSIDWEETEKRFSEIIDVAEWNQKRTEPEWWFLSIYSKPIFKDNSTGDDRADIISYKFPRYMRTMNINDLVLAGAEPPTVYKFIALGADDKAAIRDESTSSEAMFAYARAGLIDIVDSAYDKQIEDMKLKKYTWRKGVRHIHDDVLARLDPVVLDDIGMKVFILSTLMIEEKKS